MGLFPFFMLQLVEKELNTVSLDWCLFRLLYWCDKLTEASHLDLSICHFISHLHKNQVWLDALLFSSVIENEWLLCCLPVRTEGKRRGKAEKLRSIQ